MSGWKIGAIVAATLSLLVADVGHGQLIQIGPGFVRAPFVRVTQMPDGGSWVRAPFVNGYSPPPRFRPYGHPFYGRPVYGTPVYGYATPAYGTPVYGQPLPQASGSSVVASGATPRGVAAQPGAPARRTPSTASAPNSVVRASANLPLSPKPKATGPTLADPSELDWAALRRMLAAGAEQLAEQLDALQTGEGWKRHLQTELLGELLGSALSAEGTEQAPPDAPTRESLAELLALFDETAANQEFRAISSLEGFQTVRSALGELSASPRERARRQLAATVRELEAALQQLPTGDEWLRHLQLPPEVFARAVGSTPGGPLPPSVRPGAEPPLEALRAALARFDQAAVDPQARGVTRLPAFTTGRDRLADYLRSLGETPPPAPLNEPETLPPPTPDAK